MNIYAYYKMLKSTPKVDANNFEGNKYVLKSRATYKNDIFNSVIALVASLVVIFVLSLIPYVGPVFALIGFFGLLFSIIALVRSSYAYKHYYDLFTEEEIKKISKEDKTYSKKI